MKRNVKNENGVEKKSMSLTASEIVKSEVGVGNENVVNEHRSGDKHEASEKWHLRRGVKNIPEASEKNDQYRGEKIMKKQWRRMTK